MEKRTIEISLKTAKEWYKGDNKVLKNLALQAFSKKELDVYCVRSWEEFCKNYDTNDDDCFIGVYSDIIARGVHARDINLDKNLLGTKEDAEVFLALIQLKRLRDQWWESLKWKPDYMNDKSSKYAIILFKNTFVIDSCYTVNRFLVFPIEEIATDFLNCFKDLIEKVKELI